MSPNMLDKLFFDLLDRLRGLEVQEALLPVAAAVYEAVATSYPLPGAAPSGGSALQAFWTPLQESPALGLAAQQVLALEGRLPEATLQTLRRKAVDGIREWHREHPSDDGYLSIGQALTRLFDQTARAAGRSGDFLPTPQTLAALNARLLDVGEGMRVLDSSVGLGRSFVAIAEDLRARGLDPHTVQFEGQELQPRLAALAQLYLAFHGLTHATIWTGNTLTDPHFPLGSYDRVIGDPPFGLTLDRETLQENDLRFHWIDIPRFKKRAEWLFVLSGLEALKVGGEAVFVMAPGPLQRGGAEEQLRAELTRQGWLQAVVALPSALYPFTALPMTLLRFRRPDPRVTEVASVRMLDASSEAVREGRLHSLPLQARARILTDLGTDEPRQGRAVTVEVARILGSGSAWQPSLYLQPALQGTALPEDFDEQLTSALERLRATEQAVAVAFTHLQQALP